MTSENSCLTVSSKLFDRLQNEQKNDSIESKSIIKISNGNDFILNVYDNNKSSTENEKLPIRDSIAKVRKQFWNLFSGVKNENAVNLSLNNDVNYVQLDSQEKNLGNERKFRFSLFLTKYLENYHKINKSLLYKNSTVKITPNGPLILYFRDNLAQQKNDCRYENRDQKPYMNVSRVSMKLNKNGTHNFQKLKIKAEIYKKCFGTRLNVSDQNTNTVLPRKKELSDKAIQCTKVGDYIEVSPEVKFFSRSLVVANIKYKNPQFPNQKNIQCSNQSSLSNSNSSCTPSLEYVANYKPEFGCENNPGFTNLRSFSTSTILGLQNKASSVLPDAHNAPNSHRDKFYCTPRFDKNKVKRRRNSDHLVETVKQTDNEMHKYSNFIEEDLNSFSHNTKCRVTKKLKSRCVNKNDILNVKKILLENYITEVREIIHSKSEKFKENYETEILQNVKKRMDVDVAAKKSLASVQSANSDCWCPANNNEVGEQKKIGDSKGPDSAGQELPSSKSSNTVKCCYCRHYKDVQSFRSHFSDKKISAKDSGARLGVTSSHSVDSGVLMDFSRRQSDWHSESSEDSSDQGDNGSSTRSSRNDSSPRSCSDDMLCQKVESAVRKFTDELILCERKAKDRFKSQRKRRAKRRSRTPVADQSVNSTFNYLRNSHCISEDEYITDISAPSLVSL